MSITVAEQYEDRSTKIGIFQKRDHTRRFVAETTANEGSYSVATAAGVPVLGNAHPEDTAALCTDIDAKPNSSAPNVWTITCKYTTDLPSDDIDEDDPTLQQVHESWGAEDFSRFVSEDRDGNAILNKVGDRYEDPIEMVDSFPTLTVKKNKLSFIAADVFSYNNSTNSDTFKGADPGTLRVRITANKEWHDGAAYWAYNYVFRYNPNGWQPKVLETGLYQLDASGNRVPCTELGAATHDSEPVTHPAPLDVNGLQIDPSTLPGAAYYTTWNVLPELPYANLGV